MTIPKKLSDLATVALSLLLTCLAIHAVAQPDAPPGITEGVDYPWLSEHYRDHPLAGKIWHSASGQFVDEGTLKEALNRNSILLLGEKHDNPDHHALRLSLLRPLINDNTVALVALEMMSSAQQPALSDIDPLMAADHDALQTHLQWDTQGWPWSTYESLLLTLIHAGVPMRAANIDRNDITSIYRGESAAHNTRQVLNESQLAQLHTDIDVSHCGMLPESQFPNMVRIQQARDQRMADSLMYEGDSNSGSGKRVLIAGNYHIRHDLGVPNYLPYHASAPLAVAFLEVDTEKPRPTDYLPHTASQAPYDFVWFTPAVRIDDYCADMGQ